MSEYKILTPAVLKAILPSEPDNYEWKADAPWYNDTAMQLAHLVKPTDIRLAVHDEYCLYIRPYYTYYGKIWAHYVILEWHGASELDENCQWDSTDACVSLVGSGQIIWEGIKHASVGDSDDGTMYYPNFAAYGKVLIELGKLADEVVDYNDNL